MSNVYSVTYSDGTVGRIVATEEFVKGQYETYELEIAPFDPGSGPPHPGKDWRDKELKDTDWIVAVTDHPQLAAYKTYRQELRDWPSTGDFPGTKPTLGS